MTPSALGTMTQRYLTRPHPSTSFPPTFPFALTALTPHDPSSDRSFYSSPRFVNHIDDNAISQLSAFYDDVLPRSSSTLSSTSSSLPSRILDVCSSWVSHIPLNTRTKQPKAREIGMEVIGLGMNTKELAANPILSGWVIHDLNEEPSFGTALVSVQPGPARDSEQATTGEEGFDAVICNVSIDYLSRPLEVMAFIAGSLRPGCSAYMAVSNRCFLTKVRDSPRGLHHPCPRPHWCPASILVVARTRTDEKPGGLALVEHVNVRADRPRRLVLPFRGNALFR